MKYHLLPFGCQMNRSDSERIRTVLDGMGYVETENEDDKDVFIKGIVACSVRQKSIDRVYGKIHKWNQTKRESPLITFISGCILPADREKFLKLFDLVFPIEQLPSLPDMIQQYGVPTPLSVGGPAIEQFWKLKPRYSSSVEAYVPIQNGCDKFCSFCAVPYTRGREVSRPSEEILAEVSDLVDQGCKSITLLGQNVNSYGLDKEGHEILFPELMRKLGELGRQSGKQFWIYFTSPHPRDMSKELLEVMAEYPHLADWIHLPLQSGDDRILLRMNRNYSMERYRSVHDDIRRILPKATLFTDIIVGFSGENEEQFQATVQAMREFRYDMAYIAQYSPRPGARSARWEDDVGREEKERRFRILSDLLVSLAEPVNSSRIGSILPVLITGKSRKADYLSGYTEGRIPVRIKSDGAEIGQFARVKITKARPLSIEGKVLEIPGKSP